MLHVGDADPTVANFAPTGCRPRGIDVAILPFWYFSGQDHAALLKAIGALHFIASHVPLADTATVRRPLDGPTRPVTLLATPGARIEIPISAPRKEATSSASDARQDLPPGSWYLCAVRPPRLDSRNRRHHAT